MSDIMTSKPSQVDICHSELCKISREIKKIMYSNTSIKKYSKSKSQMNFGPFGKETVIVFSKFSL